MDWETSDPPIGEEIEFVTSEGETRQGALAYSGKYGGKAARAPNACGLRDQFTIMGQKLEMFEVKRWRRLG